MVTPPAGSEHFSFVEGTLRMPLLPLPLRTTLVSVPGGRILLSPGSTLSEAELRGFEEVSDIVATSLLHTDGVPAAAKMYPSARLWGPRGIATKRPELTWTSILGRDPWPYDNELAVFPIEGMPKAAESVFFHRSTKTLFVSDLAFNIDDAHGLGPWLILTLFGTYRRFGVSRLFTGMVKDRSAFEASIAPVLALDIERIVPAHGSAIEHGGRAALVSALAERGYDPR